MLRHGETDWNAQNRWQGWLDIPLNAKGRTQAHERAVSLRDEANPFVAVASSDLKRAHESACILADELGIAIRAVDSGFRERFGGDWQGLDRAEIAERWPELVEQWRAGVLAGPPNAEPIAVMLERFDHALHAVDHQVDPGPVLLVTHGGIQRAVAVRAGAVVDGVHGNLSGLWLEYDANGGILSPGVSNTPASIAPDASDDLHSMRTDPLLTTE